MDSEAKLKNGETLTLRLIEKPDDAAMPSLRQLLAHKGPMWQYHLDEMANGRIKDLETRFYVGFIGDVAVGNIMTVEHRGIGIMGHVFTRESQRRKGICDVLMGFHMEEFRARGGSVLYLNTGYDSPPWHIYRRFGYEPIEGRPGSMRWSPAPWEPESLYRDLDRADVCDLDWRHWPSMNLFTLLPFEQVVRSATYGLHGVSASEGEFLAMKRDAAKPESSVRTRVVETRDGHVAGFATLAPDRCWHGAAEFLVFDFFLHPGADEAAGDLIDEFEWPDAHVISWAAETDRTKISTLSANGFHPLSFVERFFAGGTGLVVLERDEKTR